jgi:hypothetical protein
VRGELLSVERREPHGDFRGPQLSLIHDWTTLDCSTHPPAKRDRTGWSVHPPRTTKRRWRSYIRRGNCDGGADDQGVIAARRTRRAHHEAPRLRSPSPSSSPRRRELPLSRTP